MSSIRETGFGAAEGDAGDSRCTSDGEKMATVGMRHLLSAAVAAAARPGVTADMIQGYERFASGL